MKLFEHQLPAGLTAMVLLLAGCGETPQSAVASIPAPAANLDGLSPGWNIIEPGGDTVCSDGSPYKFFVHPGASDKLMVYFQGGGACWNGGTCDPDLKPTYYVNLEKTDPAGYDGIFRFDKPENPIRVKRNLPPGDLLNLVPFMPSAYAICPFLAATPLVLTHKCLDEN